MPVVLQSDSDGNTHQLWAQEQASSCAIASIWMARNQAKQMSVDESEWALAWRTYHRVVNPLILATSAPAPVTLNPNVHQNNQNTFGNMFAVAGTLMSQVAAALRMDGLKVRNQTPFAPGTLVRADWLSTNMPAIVLLGWYNAAGARNGGHFIVAAGTTRSGKIVYLDPWGGVLSELGPGPQYQSNGRFEQVIYLAA